MMNTTLTYFLVENDMNTNVLEVSEATLWSPTNERGVTLQSILQGHNNLLGEFASLEAARSAQVAWQAERAEWRAERQAERAERAERESKERASAREEREAREWRARADAARADAAREYRARR